LEILLAHLQGQSFSPVVCEEVGNERTGQGGTPDSKSGAGDVTYVIRAFAIGTFSDIDDEGAAESPLATMEPIRFFLQIFLSQSKLQSRVEKTESRSRSSVSLRAGEERKKKKKKKGEGEGEGEGEGDGKVEEEEVWWRLELQGKCLEADNASSFIAQLNLGNVFELAISSDV